ncbi:MAG: hypothetical protein ABGY75_03645 [Gemmataceae bacterium]
MPVRFRCTWCRSKLSTARRKAGTAIDCPNCRQSVVVPNEDSGELAAVGTATASQTAEAPRARLIPSKPALDDMPLFERSDFERLLEPAVREADVDRPKPEKKPEPAAPPPPPEGVLILKSTATLLVAAVVVLMALAFAAGFLVGSR